MDRTSKVMAVVPVPDKFDTELSSVGHKKNNQINSVLPLRHQQNNTYLLSKCRPTSKPCFRTNN